MANIDAKNVMNGTYGVLRVDGLEYANISKFETKVSMEREDLQFSGNLGKDSKLISASGTGTMTFRKVNSRVVARNLPSIVTGKDFKMVLILTVDDPDGIGKETISITDVWANDFDLFNFEMGSVMEESVSFGFNPTNIVVLDAVVE